MSYAGATDTGACEGRQASPSNPNHAGDTRAKERRSNTFVFRCTDAEKAALHVKAEAAGVTSSVLLREAMYGAQSHRRRAMPRVDPLLVRAVARIGGNLNQIARQLNRAAVAGYCEPLDALAVAAKLASIERQLAQLIADNTREGEPPC